MTLNNFLGVGLIWLAFQMNVVAQPWFESGRPGGESINAPATNQTTFWLNDSKDVNSGRFPSSVRSEETSGFFEMDSRSYRITDLESPGQSRNGDSNGQLKIPEPMVFDLVRPLGAKKGELEVNTLAFFPWRSVNRDPSSDPFGSGQTTRDSGKIEWAPEVEYAFADGWAIEYELPFEGAVLEAHKLALQGTFGTAFDNRYIHGVQMIVEPTTEWRDWNSTLLYLGGIEFDERWSCLFMAGCRMNLEGSSNFETFERLLNFTLFREITPWLTFGFETNHAVGRSGRSQTLLVPQLHIELSPKFEIQSGVGYGAFDDGYEQAFVMRVIATR